ncbi:MAG: protein kinase domain-containing protein [Kofleriaceae bacterium]
MAAAAEGPRQLEPGTMLDGKYRIESLIAVGGMGAVYLGTHTALRKRVAIKVLNPQLNNPQMVERFHREAITASQIGHEGIAQVTDIGTSAENEPFLVMEYLEGESLAARIRNSGVLAVEIAAELACSILSPLGAAHAAGIVHRDLKPDNVFLVRQSRGEMVKLLDFGISRAQGLDGEFRLTTTGLVLGTPFYMSPEQARGDADITPAADLYALGVILYEMLVGRVPINADNYNQLMYKVMTGDYVPPRTLRPEIPVELEQIILATMSIEATDRPSSAAALEHALLPFCRSTFRDHTIERISAPRLVNRTTPPPMASSTPSQSLGTDRTMQAASAPPAPPLALEPAAAASPTKSKAPLFGALLVVLLGGIVGVVLVSREGTKTETPVATTEPPVSTETKSTAAKPEEPAAKPEEPAAKPEEPAAKPDEPKNITLKFTLDPPDAQIFLDDLAQPPGEITVPADGQKHQLKIVAKNYVTHEETITFDENQRFSLSLDKVEATAAKPTKPSKPPKPTKPTKPTGKGGKTERIDTTSPYQ